MGQEGVAIRVIVATPARTCSQKIANLQAGIKVILRASLCFALLRSASSAAGATMGTDEVKDAQEASPEHKWVLCVDDDVLLYVTFLEDLISSMQEDATVFMATGLLLLTFHIPMLLCMRSRD